MSRAVTKTHVPRRVHDQVADEIGAGQRVGERGLRAAGRVGRAESQAEFRAVRVERAEVAPRREDDAEEVVRDRVPLLIREVFQAAREVDEVQFLRRAGGVADEHAGGEPALDAIARVARGGFD